MPCPTSACRIPAARSLHPAGTTHRAGPLFTRHQRRFTRFTRPVCPSPVTPQWVGDPSASPRASHPAVTSSARQGQGQAASTRPGLHDRHHIGPPNRESTRKVRPRVATAVEDVRSGPTAPATRATRRALSIKWGAWVGLEDTDQSQVVGHSMNDPVALSKPRRPGPTYLAPPRRSSTRRAATNALTHQRTQPVSLNYPVETPRCPGMSVHCLFPDDPLATDLCRDIKSCSVAPIECFRANEVPLFRWCCVSAAPLRCT